MSAPSVKKTNWEADVSPAPDHKFTKITNCFGIMPSKFNGSKNDPDNYSKDNKHNENSENMHFTDIADEVGMHGLANVCKTKSTSRKIIWILMLCSAFTASLFYITTRLSDYMGYAASSTSRDFYENTEHTLPFPAVTICNNNPFLLSRNRLRSDLVKEVVDLLCV